MPNPVLDLRLLKAGSPVAQNLPKYIVDLREKHMQLEKETNTEFVQINKNKPKKNNTETNPESPEESLKPSSCPSNLSENSEANGQFVEKKSNLDVPGASGAPQEEANTSLDCSDDDSFYPKPPPGKPVEDYPGKVSNYVPSFRVNCYRCVYYTCLYKFVYKSTLLYHYF